MYSRIFNLELYLCISLLTSSHIVMMMAYTSCCPTQVLFFLFIIGFLLLTLPAKIAASVFNDVNCTSNNTFSPNSTFQIDLNTLLSDLYSAAMNNARYYNATAGGGKKKSDTVYGLYICAAVTCLFHYAENASVLPH